MNSIITEDKKMKKLIQLAETVAHSKATVLIQGESGTGKELIAHFIHQNSSRNKQNFIAINCAAIPDTLLESELFGYERGAFTGAVSSKAGKFELSHQGTLLLDEISEMDLRLQAKLLRVLQEGEVDRIGGKKPIPIDTRIIATTNKNLAQQIHQGLFREDLFYRLNVVHFILPALRERLGDIKILALRFLKIFSEKNQKKVNDIHIKALEKLESYGWPGNIRELENMIERAVIMTKSSTLSTEDLTIPHAPRTDINFIQWKPGDTLDVIVKRTIIDALKYHKKNRTHTAKALGISIRTLRNKISDYRRSGIQV